MTATPPRADLRTLAAEAIKSRATDVIRDAEGDYTVVIQGTPHELADAVLAAVLPEHRRMVLTEAATVLRQVEDGRNEYATSSPDGTAAFLRHEASCFGTAAKIVEGDLTPLYGLLPSWRWTDAMRLAAAAPPAGLSAPVPAGNAPAVPEAADGPSRALTRPIKLGRRTDAERADYLTQKLVEIMAERDDALADRSPSPAPKAAPDEVPPWGGTGTLADHIRHHGDGRTEDNDDAS